MALQSNAIMTATWRGSQRYSRQITLSIIFYYPFTSTETKLLTKFWLTFQKRPRKMLNQVKSASSLSSRNLGYSHWNSEPQISSISVSKPQGFLSLTMMPTLLEMLECWVSLTFSTWVVQVNLPKVPRLIQDKVSSHSFCTLWLALQMFQIVLSKILVVERKNEIVSYNLII